MKLEGRSALVTGGSKGIGRAIVKKLLSEGASVLTFARGKESLQSLESECRDLPGELQWMVLDACVPENPLKAIEQTAESFGGLDILVNNLGGITRFGGIDDVTDEDFQLCFDLNVMTFVRFSREAIPHLRKSNYGRIVNISSISGAQPRCHIPHYSLTKAATINLSKYFANILAKDNIPVNVVCPGPVYSDLVERNINIQAEKRDCSFDQAKEDFLDEIAEQIPLGRIGEGDDIASLVTFLASDDAAWTTGSCFHVNGGKLQSAF